MLPIELYSTLNDGLREEDTSCSKPRENSENAQAL
jgi:hypothetical protein